MPRRGPVVPLVPSTPVVRGVLLWLARFVPCVRYKVLPAWCFADQSGTKLSLCGQNVPNWAISGEQGEFYTGHAARGGVRGEFYTGYAARGGVRGEFYTDAARCGSCWANKVVLWRSSCASWWAMAALHRRSRAPQPGALAPPVPSAPVGPGVLRVIRVGSKPGQAPPPPAGTAAWPSGPSGALHARGAWCAVMASPFSDLYSV